MNIWPANAPYRCLLPALLLAAAGCGGASGDAQAERAPGLSGDEAPSGAEAAPVADAQQACRERVQAAYEQEVATLLRQRDMASREECMQDYKDMIFGMGSIDAPAMNSCNWQLDIMAHRRDRHGSACAGPDTPEGGGS